MKKISKPKMRTYQLLTLLAVLVPSVSSAEMAFTDMYVGGFGGAVFGVDAEGEAPLLVGNPSLDFDPDGQYALGLVFGARVAPNLRAEVELSYSNSDVDKTSTVLNVIAADGDLSSTSLLINGWYDFQTNSSWRPYVGGGIGYTSRQHPSTTDRGEKRQQPHERKNDGLETENYTYSNCNSPARGLRRGHRVLQCASRWYAGRRQRVGPVFF